MELLDFQKLEKKWKSTSTTEDVAIALYFKNEEEILVCEEHRPFLVENRAKGAHGEVFVKERTILVYAGEGSPNSFGTKTAFNVQKAMKHVHKKLKSFGCVKVHLLPHGFLEHQVEHLVLRNAFYGLILSGYSYDFLLKKKDTNEFSLAIPDEFDETVKIAFAQNFARFLGDTPANLMTPVLFARYAEEYLKNEECVEIRVLDRKELEKLSMGLMLGVNEGSVQEPRLVTLKYTGNHSTKAVKLALVGKGVTFDTGGISLKPSAGMAAMKFDMMGAASMLATFKLIAEMKLSINVTATLPMVENMPSGCATKPGDVHVGRSGISVEVDNTDAEGRLILADALTYAQEAKPEYVVDAATLTGAIVVSLGSLYGGFFSNDESFASLIAKSSESTNELLWRMPLSDFYRDSMQSHVADINNMGGKGAGSAKAAIFLKEFINKDTKWAHFDIAGLMNDAYLKEVYGNGATGRPIPAFIELAKNLQDN